MERRHKQRHSENPVKLVQTRKAPNAFVHAGHNKHSNAQHSIYGGKMLPGVHIFCFDQRIAKIESQQKGKEIGCIDSKHVIQRDSGSYLFPMFQFETVIGTIRVHVSLPTDIITNNLFL